MFFCFFLESLSERLTEHLVDTRDWDPTGQNRRLLISCVDMTELSDVKLEGQDHV